MNAKASARKAQGVPEELSQPTFVAEAIDLGFGLTKRTGRNANGDREYVAFPSIALQSDPAAVRDLALRARQTVDVPVRGMLFEVGPEISLAQTGNDFGKDMTENFYATDTYEALMKGALRYMGHPQIDVLLVGLPMNQYQVKERRQFLEDKYTGVLQLSVDPKTGEGITTEIKQVIVHPQPFGAYCDMFNHLDTINEEIIRCQAIGGGLEPLKDPDELHEMVILVVDPGEYTLDWLLVNKGNIVPKASGAVNEAGRHRVLSEVSKHLSEDAKTQLGGLWYSKIDEALRTEKAIKIEGTNYNPSTYLPQMRATISDPIARMFDGLKAMGGTLDLIVVVGGHPELYRDELKTRLPKIPCCILPEPVFANIRGFDAAATECARRDAEEKNAAR